MLSFSARSINSWPRQPNSHASSITVPPPFHEPPHNEVQVRDHAGERYILCTYANPAPFSLAKALKITTDELLGAAPVKKQTKPRDTRLHRRLEQIDQLGAKEKRQVMQFLDTVIEREKLRQKVGS